MKIAIPSKGPKGLLEEVEEHFGRAEYYTIVEVSDNKEITRVQVEKTPFTSHGPGDIPNWLKSLGVDLVIARGMGHRAVDFFNQLGIQVVTGANGMIKDIVDAYLKGTLVVEEWKGKECGEGECDH
ncbi:MAG: dinitrogenase iron-molybdenum cofactor [Candidatus Hydrothermota bacterium]|nr:NifB/NifX family molybdenum-iron cluster-binding protein [Candidatus Hydrothermae bacterium]RKY97306.1 MAG: dinitrogenase iron-molybdenum cofactor [Candidatus Hydrothermae bacterium]